MARRSADRRSRTSELLGVSPRDRGGPRVDRESGRGAVRGAGRRRERIGQGTGRTDAAQARCASRPPVLHAELRGAAGRPRRIGTVRSCAWRLHRRGWRTARACSRTRTPARCFSTKSASCRRGHRPSCCAPFRRARSGGSGRTSAGGSTCGWSRRPIATFAPRRRPAGSGPTCCIGSTSSASRCLRCASVGTTSRCWPSTSGAKRRERVGSRATLSAATLSALARYDWPGNIRELQNVLASLAVRCPKRGVVPPSALPPQFGERQLAGSFRLESARRTFDQSFVRAALVRAGGQRSRAAEELGVSRQGLAKLIARLEIEDGIEAQRRRAVQD